MWEGVDDGRIALATQPGTEVSEHGVLLLNQTVKDGVQQRHGLRALTHLVAREPVNQLHHQRLKQLTTHLKNRQTNSMDFCHLVAHEQVNLLHQQQLKLLMALLKNTKTHSMTSCHLAACVPVNRLQQLKQLMTNLKNTKTSSMASCHLFYPKSVNQLHQQWFKLLTHLVHTKRSIQ